MLKPITKIHCPKCGGEDVQRVGMVPPQKLTLWVCNTCSEKDNANKFTIKIAWPGKAPVQRTAKKREG